MPQDGGNKPEGNKPEGNFALRKRREGEALDTIDNENRPATKDPNLQVDHGGKESGNKTSGGSGGTTTSGGATTGGGASSKNSSGEPKEPRPHRDF